MLQDDCSHRLLPGYDDDEVASPPFRFARFEQLMSFSYLCHIRHPSEYSYDVLHWLSKRQPDWRWAYAHHLWECNHAATCDDDTFVAFDLLRSRAGGLTPTAGMKPIIDAILIHEQNGPVRWMLEAHLLLRKPPTNLAAKLGLHPVTIRYFESWFFDVAWWRTNPNYIGAMSVIGGSPWLGYADDDLGPIWRHMAYFSQSERCLDIVVAVTTGFGLQRFPEQTCDNARIWVDDLRLGVVFHPDDVIELHNRQRVEDYRAQMASEGKAVRLNVKRRRLRSLPVRRIQKIRDRQAARKKERVREERTRLQHLLRESDRLWKETWMWLQALVEARVLLARDSRGQKRKARRKVGSQHSRCPSDSLEPGADLRTRLMSLNREAAGGDPRSICALRLFLDERPGILSGVIALNRQSMALWADHQYRPEEIDGREGTALERVVKDAVCITEFNCRHSDFLLDSGPATPLSYAARRARIEKADYRLRRAERLLARLRTIDVLAVTGDPRIVTRAPARPGSAVAMDDPCNARRSA